MNCIFFFESHSIYFSKQRGYYLPFFKKKLFFLFLAALGLLLHTGFSLVVVHGLLIVVASLVVEHGVCASVVVAHGLSSCGSQALERRLSSCGAWA